MKLRPFLYALAFVGVSAAHAQPAQPPQNPREQALTAKLIDEINANIALRSNMVVLQEEIAKLQAEAKKQEPAKDANGNQPKKKP